MIWGMPEAIQQFIPDPDISSYLAGSDHDVEEVLDLYSKDRPGQTRRELLAAVVTDGMFTIPAIRFAEAQLAHHPNVHMYRFSWRPPVQGGMMGAGHMVELPFVFDDLGNAADLVGPNPPMALAAAIHSSWVRFAATGDPNGGDLPQWPTYDADRRPVMDFDTTSEVVDDPGSSERRLWDDLL